jgi:signal transduction histidine kinase/DNA-binding response OmpR family regulator
MPDPWTLLIIDDCAEDRKVYRRYLLKDLQQSYQFLEADSAQDGLALCQQMQCDAILLDFCLPDLSGLELLERIEQDIFNTNLPVIMLTGQGDEEIAVQAMKRGVKDYLVKQHLKPDVLQVTVRNAIARSHLQVRQSKKQEKQSLIATTALRMRQSLNLEQILQTAVVEVQQLLKCDRVMVYQMVSESQGKETLLCDRHAQRSQNDYASLIHSGFNSEELLDSQANLAVPIHLSHNGLATPKLWGWLIAHQSSQQRQWQSDEIEILNELSVQLAIAIQQAELLAQTQAALEQQKQLNAFKSKIVANVSHEYRTPLASILAAASTLKQNSQRLDTSKQQRFFQIIEEKARHLSKLVDDMLVVNKFELDKAKLKPVPLDLLHFFSELIEEQQHTLRDVHQINFKLSGNCQGFWGDGVLLQQIFANLISNAIKYSPNGGDIEFHLIGKDSQVIFSVEDQGIGIPVEDQQNLFQSFNRGSNVGTIPGTGLGLAIAKYCVNLHGGDITLESQVGKGTKIIVTLPKQPLNILSDIDEKKHSQDTRTDSLRLSRSC